MPRDVYKRQVQSALCARRPHRHRDDLVDFDRAALADLHRGLDRMRVIRIQRPLTTAIKTTSRRIGALTHRGVRHLLHKNTDLQLNSFGAGQD